MDKIPLKRLKDHKVKGKFTINCENYTQYKQLEDFFHTDKGFIKFKDIANAFHEKQSYMSKIVKKWEKVLNAPFSDDIKTATSIILESEDHYIPSEQFVATRKKTDKSLKEQYKFVIIYESLQELLKLRDIFKIRANKFDMKLIKKRNTVHFFSDDFYKEFDNLEISKIRT